MPEVLEREASNLFSAAVFRPIVAGQHPHRANRLALGLQSGLGLSSDSTNRSIVSAAFAVLCERYRCEYFYKNLIANKIFIGRHRASNSVLLPEFRIHDSVADCVFINGEATVYEIKTEYDSPEKLERQLESYFQAFTLVNVVTHADDVDRYITLLEDTPTGLFTVGSCQRLSMVKAPASCPSRLSVKVMFDSLRLREVTSILERAFGSVPQVPNGLRYTAFLEVAQRIPPSDFQRGDAYRTQVSRRPELSEPHAR